MNEAGVAPPGVTPIQQPTKALRMPVTQKRGSCFQVSSTTRADAGAPGAAGAILG